MKQPLERIVSDRQLPTSVDVVIIGAGIAGSSAAWELSKRGMRVALLEKGVVGGEQSSRNWGWCRQQGRDPNELELAKLSLDLWPAVEKTLGRSLGFERCGVTFLTDKEDEAAAWPAWQKEAAARGIHSELLSAAQARDIVGGGTSAKWIAGLRTPSDGRAEPSRAAPFMAMAAQALGATVIESCAVHDVERTNGRVSAVQTEKGRIACGAVIVAAGAWTALFLRKLGVAFPQAYVSGSVARTVPTEQKFSSCISTPYFSMRNCENGGLTLAKSGRGTIYLTPSLLRNARQFLPTYRLRRKNVTLKFTSQFWREWKQERDYLKRNISPFESMRVLDPAADPALLDHAVRDVAGTFPGLSKIAIDTSWGGVIDSTPDAVPVISEIAQKRGVFVASGFSGHGFGLGPAVGNVLASLVLGEKPAVDMTPFRYERMIDGTRLEPYIHF